MQRMGTCMGELQHLGSRGTLESGARYIEESGHAHQTVPTRRQYSERTYHEELSLEAQTHTLCTKQRIAPLTATPPLARVISDTKSA